MSVQTRHNAFAHRVLEIRIEKLRRKSSFEFDADHFLHVFFCACLAASLGKVLVGAHSMDFDISRNTLLLYYLVYG